MPTLQGFNVGSTEVIVETLERCGRKSMHQVNFVEAAAHLEELIEAAASGEEVVIVGNDGSSFKIVPTDSTEARPKFGSAKGLIVMSDDFDEPKRGF